jgi:hypothetical protein
MASDEGDGFRYAQPILRIHADHICDILSIALLLLDFTCQTARYAPAQLRDLAAPFARVLL